MTANEWFAIQEIKMSETFKCCNCGFECEIINSENLDIGIAECEKCGMKGLRQQNPNNSFVDSFCAVIAMIDPQANSLMSKDMPPTVKLLADWSRKACDELDSIQAQLAQANDINKRLRETSKITIDIMTGDLDRANDEIKQLREALGKAVFDIETAELGEGYELNLRRAIDDIYKALKGESAYNL